MSKTIKLSLLLLIISCSFKPEAKGVENEIMVFVSPEDKPFILPVFSKLFSAHINTPQEEYEFKISYKNPWQFEEYKHHPNLLIASINFPEDSTGDLLMDKLLTSQNIEHSLFNLENLYAKKQIVTGINTLDGISLGVEIEKSGSWILSQYRESFNKKMTENVYMHGVNEELSAAVDSSAQFIWAGRGYPYRWITMHKSVKKIYIDPNSAWAQLAADFHKNIPEITISQFFRKNEKIELINKGIPLFRGMYEHAESESGGPFFVYIFDTDLPDEVILVGGFVNYPGREKLLLLKQLEIIAQTIHKKGSN